MPRVLHGITSLEGGGAERQLAYLAAEQARTGHEVHVVVLRRGPNYARVVRGGARVHELPSTRIHDPRIALGVARLLREVRPDVFQSWLLAMDFWGGLAARATRTPWVMTERSNPFAYRRAAQTQSIVQWVAGRLPNAIVANSRVGLDYWERRSPSRVHKYVIPNGTAVDEIDAVLPAEQPACPVDAGRAVVVWVGRLDDAQKNVIRFVDAMAVVPKRLDAVALICGDGPDRARVVERVRENQIEDRVFLLGYRDDIWALMKRADVFVSVSPSEGNPNAVLEAAACLCPLVVSDIAAHRELLTDAEAILVPATDTSAIADGIVRTLSERDETRRRAAGARLVAQRRSLSAMAEAYDAVYAAVIEDARPGG
jgi:glycosyltransferase involved in cell wall biosynthesis